MFIVFEFVLKVISMFCISACVVFASDVVMYIIGKFIDNNFFTDPRCNLFSALMAQIREIKGRKEND